MYLAYWTMLEILISSLNKLHRAIIMMHCQQRGITCCSHLFKNNKKLTAICADILRLICCFSWILIFGVNEQTRTGSKHILKAEAGPKKYLLSLSLIELFHFKETFFRLCKVNAKELISVRPQLIQVVVMHKELLPQWTRAEPQCLTLPKGRKYANTDGKTAAKSSKISHISTYGTSLTLLHHKDSL